MKNHTMIALSLLMLLVLGGCNFTDSFLETQAQAEAVATELEGKFGGKPLVGWNINNGTLTEVNVIFESKHVASLTIEQLEPTVRSAVESAFKRKPQQLLISVQVSAP